LADNMGSIYFNSLQDRGDEIWLPDKQRKTAGRAATLRSGIFNSCGAISCVYWITDSRASAKFAGGDV
jgi:hypothetical protein